MDPTTDYPTLPADILLSASADRSLPEPKILRDLFTQAHQQSDMIYNDDGSWGRGFVHDASTARWRALFAAPDDYTDRPTVRDTARRLAGYARALDVYPNPVYRARLESGVEWLLSQQLADGSFPWWVSRTGMPNTDHLFYVTAYATIGLLEAFRHFPRLSILDAVARAATWTALRPPSQNNNHNSLACWTLVSWYRIDPNPQLLEAAVRLTLEGVLPKQLPNGGWAGHNSWVYYQGIIVAGLAMLLSAMNNLIWRQHADGTLLATFDAQERTEAQRRRIGYEQNPEAIADPHALIGLLWTHELRHYPIEATIRNLIHAYVERLHGAGSEDPGGHGIHMMALGYAWNWVTQETQRQTAIE